MEPALAAIRFAHFTSVMFMFGAGAFLLVFTTGELRAELSARLHRPAIVASLIAFLTALAWLSMESASMNEDYAAAFDTGSISDVLTSTAFGAIWQGRIALSVVAIIAFVLIRAERWRVATTLSAFLLASLALVDHGAMQTGALGLAHRGNDALHLLTTGGWLGALAPFVLCLGCATHGPNRAEANLAMLRFSAAGHFGVLLILATGAINILLTTHALPWPPTSPYRALLVGKIGVVLVMIGLAAINRYALLPRIETDPRGEYLLRLFASVELALALIVVGLVSYFGLLDPA